MNLKIRRALVPILFFILGSGPSLSYAHHPPATSRPSPKLRSVDSGTSRIGVSYLISYYASTQEGDKSYDKIGLGKVLHQRLSLDGSWALKSGTFFDANVPLGAVDVYPKNGESRSMKGLGDLRFRVGQGLDLPLNEEHKISLSGHLGMELATGKYSADSIITKTDVSAGKNGTLDVETFNTNTGLGSGAYKGLLGIEVSYNLHDKIDISMAQTLGIPWSRTPDDILWGVDSTTLLRANWGLFSLVSSGLSLSYLRHFPDEVVNNPENIEGSKYVKLGGRHQFSVGVDTKVSFSPKLSCSVGITLPIYQQVEGIQLVETITGGFMCGFAFDL